MYSQGHGGQNDGTKQTHDTRTIRQLFGCAIALSLTGSSLAASFDTGNSDTKLRWDNTVKYSAAWRVKDQSDALIASPTHDDGDRNFRKGLISNRIDWLSEFDASYKDVGLRVSGAGWYDRVYNRRNDNDSPATNNALSVPYNEFTDATRDLHGRRVELLDAFVYGKASFGDMSGTLRAGRHTLIYGESLFFGSNGIANAQGPVDIVKLLTVPSSQFKEVLRPVEQISGSLSINPNLSVGAYYQFKWHESKIPAVGSYLSSFDAVGDGTETAVPPGLVPGGLFIHAQDIEPRNSGQGGMQLRWTPEGSPVEYGFYAARYHDKTPTALYLDPINNRSHWVFAEGIRTFGASATVSIGQLNLAAEASVRRNTPLVSDAQLMLGQPADNDSHPLYAVGNSAHAQISGIYVLQPTALWGAGTVLGEIAWHRRTSVTKNAAALDPNTTRDAAALRVIFEPAYFQVVPGLDITVPIGVGWNFSGRSSVISNFNGGSSHAGDMSFGVNGTFQQVWQFGVNYVHFFGSEGTFLTSENLLSFKQTLKDRDFISINFKRTF